jgi:universal stress protein E
MSVPSVWSVMQPGMVRALHDHRKQGQASMHPIRRILVAVKDPRARRFPALTKAVQLAHGLRAELCLFHAVAEPIYLDIGTVGGKSAEQLERETLARHRERVARLARNLPRADWIRTEVVWDHPTHEAVIRAAARYRAGLIVAECHARHLAPWLLHFTDWELLRRSPIPVLLVKSGGLYRRPNVLAAIDPGPAKPANLDAEILRYGAMVAGALSGALHAVHACSLKPVDMTAGEFATVRGVAAARDRAVAAAHAALGPRLSAIGIPKARRHLVEGFAVDVIQDVAEEVHAGILLMGAVSRSGLRRLLIGNTAERMLDRIACDVLIVKPRQFPDRTPRRLRGPQIIAGRLLPAVMH